MVNSEFVNALSEIPMNKPFRRASFVAMMLGFCPYYYTKDYDDLDITYGRPKFVSNIKRLTYIQCKRLLFKNGFTDEALLYSYYKKNDWDSIENLLAKSRVDTSSIDKGTWRYFKSLSFENGNKGFHSDQVNHRLYLTIGLDQRGKFADTFISNCVKNGTPYYFKVFTHKGQTDTIVIYVDDVENLKETINIINQIYASDKNIDIRTNTKPTAPHLYKVNDYIGYGFEPKLEVGKDSYSGVIRECCASVTDKRNDLRRKIINDFDIGNIYRISGVNVPPIDECRKFSKSSRNDQFLFFKKYFPYILAVYGVEIYDIMDEIEHNLEQKLTDLKMVGKKN